MAVMLIGLKVYLILHLLPSWQVIMLNRSALIVFRTRLPDTSGWKNRAVFLLDSRVSFPVSRPVPSGLCRCVCWNSLGVKPGTLANDSVLFLAKALLTETALRPRTLTMLFGQVCVMTLWLEVTKASVPVSPALPLVWMRKVPTLVLNAFE